MSSTLQEGITIPQDVLDAFYGRYTTIAGAALLFYDTILTLDDEVC